MPFVRTRSLLFGTAAASIVVAGAMGAAQDRNQSPSPRGTQSADFVVLFNRFQVPVMSLFVADADGGNERALIKTDGLQYSPSYSLDGRWIVFTAERQGQADIYRVHPDGTGVEQLTNDAAFDDQGTLSPDGTTLAFVSTRAGGIANIFLLDLGSKRTTNLTRSQSGNFRPSWSPDGRSIAFTSDRDSHPGIFPGRWEHLQSTGVYMVSSTGTGLRRLTRKDGVAGSPSWSADGRNVLVYETDEVGAYLAKSGNSRTEIASIDVETGTRSTVHSIERNQAVAALPAKRGNQLHQAGCRRYCRLARAHPTRGARTIIPGAIRNPSWSLDRKQVVYQRISRLGSTEHLVQTFSRDPQFDLLLSEPFPSFSPDGKQLLYSQYGLGKSAATGLPNSSAANTTIEIMAANGTGKHTLFQREGFSAFSAAWSPKGDVIALSVGRYFRAAGPPPGQIALVKPDGSDLRLIVDDAMNNGFASWSPDGNRLVFKRGRQLVTMTLPDRQIVPLTDGTHYDNFPQWSPRGDVIMFTSDRSGSFGLYTIRPDGTDLRRVTTGSTTDAHSTWCAGGDWIVFSTARMGFKDEMALYDAIPQPYGEIFAMRADGSDVRQLTDNKWEDASAACRPKASGESTREEVAR